MARAVSPLGLNVPGAGYSATLGLDPGTSMFSFGGALVNGSTGGASIVTSPVKGDTHALKLTPTASPCRTNLGSVGTPLNWPTDPFTKNFSVYAYTDASSPRSVEFLLTADNFTNYSRGMITVLPGTWQLFVIPRRMFVIGAGTGFPWGTPIQILRIANANSGGDIPAIVASSGETTYISGMYINAPTRAKFMICFDDFRDDLVVDGGFSMVDGTGTSRTHSYQSFVESYGWKMTYHAQAGNLALNLVGAVGGTVMTPAQVDAFYEAGHTVATQTWYAPIAANVAGAASNSGARLLGPYGRSLLGVGVPFTCSETNLSVTPSNDYSLALEDFTLARDWLVSQGWLTAARHFSCNQNAHDQYVNQALDSIGAKTVRVGLSGSNTNLAAGYMLGITGGVYPGASAHLGYMVNCPNTVGVDGAQADATIQAFVDEMIQQGGIGASVSHSFDAGATASGAKTKVLCDYLRLKERQGLIDIVSAEELYQQSLGARTSASRASTASRIVVASRIAA